LEKHLNKRSKRVGLEGAWKDIGDSPPPFGRSFFEEAREAKKRGYTGGGGLYKIPAAGKKPLHLGGHVAAKTNGGKRTAFPCTDVQRSKSPRAKGKRKKEGSGKSF